jgi:hypothetical protein
MRRATLNHWLRRMALIGMPILCGCGSVENNSDLGDLSAVYDMAGNPDLICATRDTVFSWTRYLDGGHTSDMYEAWFFDAGAPQTCDPCGFASTADVACGVCKITNLACGVGIECLVPPDCTGAGVGRRPAGLVTPSLPPVDELGGWLAKNAHLEAASVPAFARLADELAAHNAPEHLIAGARRALRDEERHAAMMSDLARAAGARIPLVEIEPVKLRDLEEVALENVVEGCVREATGAVTAARQAMAATDPVLKKILSSIAVDEKRHAELAWAVDRWAWPRLSPAARRRVGIATQAALLEV